MSKLKNNEDIYLDEKSCKEILSVSTDKFRIIKQEFDISEKVYSGKVKYSKEEILKFKSERDNFWEKHIPISFAKKEYGQSTTSKLTRIDVPIYFIMNSCKTVYSKEELENTISYYRENFITYKETVDRLDLSQDIFFKLIREGKIETTKANKQTSHTSSGTLYSKKDVLSIQKKQEDFLKEVLTHNQVVDMYGITATEKCKCYPVPSELRRREVFKVSNYYYKKSEIEEYMSLRNKKLDSTSLELNTPLKTCFARLELRCEHHSFGNRPYTEEKLTKFIEVKLDDIVVKFQKNKQNDKYLNNRINAFADIIGHILKFLDENMKPGQKEREIYSLSTAECELLIYTMENKRSQEIIYMFLKEVQQDIVLNRKNIDTSLIRKRGFNLDNITPPNRKVKTKRSTDINETLEEIYTFETYMALFSFVTDTAMHLKNFYKLKDEQRKFRYLSVWLYLILQLTNAWRTIDIKDFPRLQIDDILEQNNISDISWFKENLIDLPTSRQLVAKVLKHNFLISKTGKKNNFYSSDNISQVFATAMILLELCHKKTTITIVEYDEPIMHFAVKYNYPRDRTMESFLKEIKTIFPDFKYSNKKMTDTILSFSKVISPSEYGILVSKHERAHEKLSSTFHYVKFPQKQMEFISEQLFERGEFGFIYDTLIDIVYGNKDKMSLIKERTNMIVAIKKTFGSVNKIEETIKLTNYNDQIDIINMLFEKGIDGCNQILQSLNFNKLQSQEPHIQCLCSESGCLQPERHPFPMNPGCVGCKYSIKNVYTLSVLGERIKSDCEEYLSSTNKIRKRKLSMRFFKYKQIVLDAIKKFGKEYTYSSLGIDLPRDVFANYVRQIERPSDILKSDLELLLGRK